MKRLIKIFGSDLAELRSIGEQVRDTIEPIAGVVDLQLEPQLPIQQVQIQYDRAAAAGYGLTMAQISGVVETALLWKRVSKLQPIRLRRFLAMKSPGMRCITLR
jgi:nickel/cobalt tolerance cation efflux system protein